MFPDRALQGRSGVDGRKGQRGQALIYGLFVLTGGLVALFFLFNTGQLTSEKTRLVNTADAVAYSAGVMHARGLNFLAYTNRALIANEIAIAQAVSLSSWARYVDEHGKGTVPLNCGSQYSYPVAKVLVKYAPLCAVLFYEQKNGVTAAQRSSAEKTGEVLTPFAEAAKAALQASQAFVQADMPLARATVMRQVAQANYANDGGIIVDTIPLTDTWSLLDGKPLIERYSGSDRKRLAEVTIASTHKDDFVKRRNWRDNSLVPSACIAIGRLRYDYVDRSGATRLDGYDDWKANDKVSAYERYIKFHKFSLPSCKTRERKIGRGDQSARAWGYLGLPSFYDLSDKALAYRPSHSDPEQRDPKAQFVIRLRRAKAQTRTSDARSQIGRSDSLNDYQASPAGGVYAAVAGSEVYFQRPQLRQDSQQELASLFNPYWQVHLIDVSAKALAARALQGVAAP